MQAEFRHVVLTVFNVKLHFGGNVAPDEDWLRHRFDLFHRLCYPSMRGQTNQNFLWLVLFDAATPQPFREKISACAEWKNFVPHFTDEVMSPESFAMKRKSLIADHVGPAPFLITTTLDNDDAVHREYIATIQNRFARQPREFLNFADGYALDYRRRRLYRKHDPASPFVSVIESMEGAQTVWIAPHRDLHAHGPVAQESGRPMWIQVIHGRNAVNRLDFFTRVPMKELQQGFSLAWDDMPVHESKIAVLSENVVNMVLRKTLYLLGR